MSSLPDVSLGGPPAADRDDLTAPDEPVRKTLDVQPVKVADDGRELVPVELPESDLDGDRMTGLERALVLVAHWCRQASATLKVAGSEGGISAAKPESFAEYRAYVRSRAWVPEGCDSGWLVWIPVTYYNTIGWLGIAGGYGFAWVFKRMFRFNVAVLLIAATTVWLIWMIKKGA